MNNLCGFGIPDGYMFNDQLYDGTIAKLALNNRIEIYECRLNCTHRFNLDFNSKMETCLFVCINMVDDAYVSLTHHDSLNVISPFSSVLIPYSGSVRLSFVFEAKKRYHFTLIKIARSHLEFNNTKLSRLFDTVSIGGEKNAISSAMPNLILCELASKLCRLDKTEAENKLIAAGYCNIILGLKLKEENLSEHTDLKANFFRSNEIKQLERLTQVIKENPECQYTIRDLCRSTGLSVTKLQSGFKNMHRCTVAIFIRNVRLEKAIDMLQTTNLNVSEIVYSVGLNSRSYFCRIFKKRFKCSPKTYQQKLRKNHL
ncbi:helix-turn-helix domain-containing protein [Mariniflexile sp.]|uniref:helix-turn-helix domain-containing protein n=1 Tax=Mariniflexile sp. TaxID=1979402 RepID=UPI004047FF33